MRGYDRQNATGIGLGAGEIILALVEHLSEQETLRVGSMLRPYERSAYVTVRSDLTESLPFRGPRLILLGDSQVRGPLTIEVGDGGTRGFDPGDIEADATCQLRSVTTRVRDDTRYVLVVGDTLEVTIDRTLLEIDEPDIPLIRDLSEIDREGPCWRHAATTLDWLLESDLDDGLGWTVRLEECVRQGVDDPELEELASSWHCCATTGLDGELPTRVEELVGRGPGATPSGDDILTGILLTLLHTTTGEQRGHVLAVGDMLVGTATDRTTRISAALLAQAAQGRAPDSVTEAIASLLRPSLSRDRHVASLRALTERGHTSGVDILVGILLTILLIGPEYDA